MFYEINSDIKILKSTFYSLRNIKILPKTTSDYRLINNYTFSNTFYQLTKNHIKVEESINTFSNSTLCLKKKNTTTTLETYKKTQQIN